MFINSFAVCQVQGNIKKSKDRVEHESECTRSNNLLYLLKGKLAEYFASGTGNDCFIEMKDALDIVDINQEIVDA